jgi:hypothetical protein
VTQYSAYSFIENLTPGPSAANRASGVVVSPIGTAIDPEPGMWLGIGSPDARNARIHPT